MSANRSRDDIRAALMGGKEFKRVPFNIFGQTVEIKQPSIKESLELAQDKRNENKSDTVLMLIHYAYVPGTNERVFSFEDYDVLVENMPNGKWAREFLEIMNNLLGTGITLEDVTKN